MNQPAWYKKLSPLKRIGIQFLFFFIIYFFTQLILQYFSNDEGEKISVSKGIPGSIITSVIFTFLMQDKPPKNIFKKNKSANNERT